MVAVRQLHLRARVRGPLVFPSSSGLARHSENRMHPHSRSGSYTHNASFLMLLLSYLTSSCHGASHKLQNAIQQTSAGWSTGPPNHQASLENGVRQADEMNPNAERLHDLKKVLGRNVMLSFKQNF